VEKKDESDDVAAGGVGLPGPSSNKAAGGGSVQGQTSVRAGPQAASV
jgi:hypothetical protein